MRRAFPGQMTTNEAVDYLNQFLTDHITRDEFDRYRAWLGAPISRQGTSRSWFHLGDLDAFLNEYGADPGTWISPPRP
ncbi:MULTISPECIES: hypothetical protein [Microbacterium]|uniref:hypothetical protein n=1 Tax=Microbacterium TaxID=33882 RepID=UPI00146B6305|nr:MULTISPECIES: hypothetical protein [Microbacterium]